MQYGNMHSVALALTQTALGPSERQAAVCCCSQPSGDSLHLESFSVSGDTKVGIQGGGVNPGGRGRLNVVFRDESRKPE